MTDDGRLGDPPQSSWWYRILTLPNRAKATALALSQSVGTGVAVAGAIFLRVFGVELEMKIIAILLISGFAVSSLIDMVWFKWAGSEAK